MATIMEKDVLLELAGAVLAGAAVRGTEADTAAAAASRMRLLSSPEAEIDFEKERFLQ